MARKDLQGDEDLHFLREIFPPGSTVYTVLRSVARSGMSRTLDVYAMCEGRPLWVTPRVARVIGCTRKGDAMRVQGCGMDMGFWVAYELARKLYQDQFRCIGEKCPSNDHTNERRNPKGYDSERIHSDAGYALRHEWI